MRKTLTLDDDVHEAAKQIAKERGITLGQMISELARQGMLLRQKEERARPKFGTSLRTRPDRDNLQDRRCHAASNPRVPLITAVGPVAAAALSV